MLSIKHKVKSNRRELIFLCRNILNVHSFTIKFYWPLTLRQETMSLFTNTGFCLWRHANLRWRARSTLCWSPPAGQEAAVANYAGTAPSSHPLPCDLQRLGLSRRRHLGIAGMTAMLSPSTLLWELDGGHWGFQCESATCHSDTHSAAEGNVSRT